MEKLVQCLENYKLKFKEKTEKTLNLQKFKKKSNLEKFVTK